MFWVVTLAMIVVALWMVARPLLRKHAQAPTSAEQDLQVYKDQLAEVDRDLSRGVLTEADAESARLEVSRRVLAADKRLQGQVARGSASPLANRLVLITSALVIAGGSVGLYLAVGNPGMPDRPLQTRLAEAKAQRDARPDQIQAETRAQRVPVEAPQEYIELVSQLRAALVDRPEDVAGHRLLAYHESQLGNYVAAREAQGKLIELLGEQTKGEDYTALAEYMVFAANGYVSPQAETALVTALNLAPTNPRARYFSGLALAQNGRPDVAYQMWAGLLEEGPEDAPWIQPIRDQIGAVARAAGIEPVQQPSGPTAQDIESAGQMSTEDRQEMIRGMVAGLAERLATQGGSAEEWARLIRAYSVLGEADRAGLIWAEAKENFASDERSMSVLRDVAQELGFE